MSEPLRYQTGFGNHLASEAVPGTIPPRGNTPKEVPHGLIAEQINGTGFTAERRANQRTWLYRLRPAIHTGPFKAVAAPGRFTGRFHDAVPTPEPMRFKPTPLPTGDVDFLDGIQTFAGAGDPALRQGMAIHVFSANQDMTRVFSNIDGDLLIAPEQGAVRIQSELGFLEARPGEIITIPRGIRFSVSLPDGPTRGFIAELFEGHFQLPERGVIGANGLADERHFRAPVAAYEDRTDPVTIVVKQGGRFFENIAPHSPFDVVAWHGRYAPFVYDLRMFMSYGSVSFDHPDPSVLTVLTAPQDDHGNNAIDVGVFLGRWDPTEDTFRPPYFHRNAAAEFNAVIASPHTKGPYPAGAFSYTPNLTPHGVSPASHRGASKASDDPVRGSDRSIWLQFESTYTLSVLPEFLESPQRDTEFLSTFEGYATGDLAP
ncbi:MAG: homogentisate 1,2-dioxygenase [Myxococcota bacterium]